MRHALALAAASCLLITPIARATESVAPTMSEELLQLWNTDYSTPEYTLDPEAVAAAEQETELQVGELFEVDVEAMEGVSPSMTPNLDRLLQRDDSGSPNVAMPLIPGVGSAYSKSGSGSTIDTGRHNTRDRDRHERNRRWCRHPCNHRPNCLPLRDRHPKPPKPPKPPKHDDDCDPPTPTPEPASMLLFGAAAATAAGIKARRRKKNAAKSL